MDLRAIGRRSELYLALVAETESLVREAASRRGTLAAPIFLEDAIEDRRLWAGLRVARILLSLILVGWACGCAAPARLSLLAATSTPSAAVAAKVAAPAAPSTAMRASQVVVPEPRDPDDPVIRERARRIEELCAVVLLTVGLLLVISRLH